MKSKYSTDWLGLPIIFYNEATNVISSNINDVIDYRNLEFDPDGLRNYLDFGYSVFGYTPIKNVKYMLPNSDLSIENGRLTIKIKKDPFSENTEKTSTEKELLQILNEKVTKWENKHKDQTIIIPTSGGYDSRLLNSLINVKKNIRSFTYGVSENQSKSQEVTYAKYVAKHLNTKWNFIPLTHINDYQLKWYELYGVSTHFHGMYHLEFYDKIHNLVPTGVVLSGIMGDAWAGNVIIPPIKRMEDVKILGYSHGINADSNYCLLEPQKDLCSEYFKKTKNKLVNSKFRIVESMRFKAVLLSYLIKVPKSYGYETWSPFLEIDVVKSMLNLPENKRRNRNWQTKYFNKNKLNPEKYNYKCDTKNTLDLQSLEQVKIKPLDTLLLKEIISPTYIDQINKKIDNFYRYKGILKIAQSLINISSINYLFHRIGFHKDIYGLNSDIYKAYSAYMTIKPLETILKLRKR